MTPMLHRVGRALWHYQRPGDYLLVCRAALQIGRAGGTVQLSWAGERLSMNGWRREFITALHRRINLKGGDDRDRRWRKFDSRYQTDLRRDAQRLNEYSSRRIVAPINRLSTPELQRRFRWSYDSVDGLSVDLRNPRRHRAA